MEESYKHFLSSPLIIGLLGVAAGAIIVATYHCLVNNCCFIQSRISGAQQSEQTQVLPITNRASTTRTIPTNSFPGHLIPTYRYTKEYREGMCAVCLCDFTDGDAIRVLPECMHLFHVGCIDMWLNSHTNCPLCRADIVPRHQRVTVERIEVIEPIPYRDSNPVPQPSLQQVGISSLAFQI